MNILHSAAVLGASAFLAASLPGAPLKVFILAGQSNTQGIAKTADLPSESLSIPDTRSIPTYSTDHPLRAQIVPGSTDEVHLAATVHLNLSRSMSRVGPVISSAGPTLRLGADSPRARTQGMPELQRMKEER